MSQAHFSSDEKQFLVYGYFLPWCLLHVDLVTSPTEVRAMILEQLQVAAFNTSYLQHRLHVISVL